METEIYNFAKQRNLEAGITTAEPFIELEQILLQKNKYLKGFAEQDIKKRIYPNLTMKNAKSIIVFAMGYGVQKQQKQYTELMGEFSVAAVEKDYHLILKEYFKELEQLLKQKQPCFECQYFVDTGPLVDRAVAKRAGLGYIGKNQSIHTAKFGSLVFLGYMITNLSLQQKETISGHCGNCQECIINCPTGALSHKNFDMKKCISYLTQTKTVLEKQTMKTMGKQIYGCDVCQMVCPKNQKVIQSFEQIDTNISLESLLHCSNKWFLENINNTAAGWRGKKILQRNAVIALGNSKTKKALPLLQEALQDKRDLIRHTTVRAICNLNLPEGYLLLQKAEKTEQCHEIKEEIRGILWDIGIQED